MCQEMLQELFDRVASALEVNDLSGPQQQDATYFFQATIVLTEKSLKVAHKHFVVVKVFREQSAVLLDGLFNVPKLFCMNVLKRYTQIDSLYRVVNLDVAL